MKPAAPPPASTAFLSVRELRKHYGATPILRGVSCAVQAGESVAIIGPSGGGKSTLLRCANGLAHFDAGEVQVGEHRLVAGASRAENRAAHRQVRRALGMIFQDFQLFPHMTALDNVALGPMAVLGQRKRDARERAHALLDRVGLGARATAYPRELSGGQKQRVAIARALAMEPRGLLCDEITSALDPELRHEVVSVLESLRKDGLMLLLVTHELSFARRLADRVLVLADGEIAETGPTAEVLDHPQSERAQRFLRLL